MKKVKGTVASGGIVLGNIRTVKKEEIKIVKESTLKPEEELARLEMAVSRECEALSALQEKVQITTGDNEAAIFEMYAMLLEDKGYCDAMEQCIRVEHATAEYAVSQIGARYEEKFAAMEDSYMQARAADFRELTARLLRMLQESGQEDCICPANGAESRIYMAEDFEAGFIAENADTIAALVCTAGSPYSHAAILAKGLGIPMLVKADVDLEKLAAGDGIAGTEEATKVCVSVEAIVDAQAGEVIFAPDEKAKTEAMRKMSVLAESKQLNEIYRGKETVTKSGKKIRLFANAGSVADVEAALTNDAEGIGLFRSEYLFMGRNTLPTEEEQFAVYKQIAELCGEKKAIIRTVDLGADKQAQCLALAEEENPAMGYRGIRICLDRQDVFKTQLRAIYRAAVHGNLAVMYPMIVSVEEVEQIRQISAEVKAELAAQGLVYKDVEEGIMVETPAAVMISDKLAELADFFSIGTNDLTQYTLAADRGNGKIASVYNPHHEAVIRMIGLVVDNAHAAGIPVGICGELASDEQMVAKFAKLGVDELSVTPGVVLGMRKAVLEAL